MDRRLKRMNNGAQLRHSQSDVSDIEANVKAYHPRLYDPLQRRWMPDSHSPNAKYNDLCRSDPWPSDGRVRERPGARTNLKDSAAGYPRILAPVNNRASNVKPTTKSFR